MLYSYLTFIFPVVLQFTKFYIFKFTYTVLKGRFEVTFFPGPPPEVPPLPLLLGHVILLHIHILLVRVECQLRLGVGQEALPTLLPPQQFLQRVNSLKLQATNELIIIPINNIL